ncbi:hypothetical protein K501DRAFT_329798 [Backusella circina FSU 941]|nr:hypothetical protein K501DRAFT_329798 [Backusella circina FSU 941]
MPPCFRSLTQTIIKRGIHANNAYKISQNGSQPPLQLPPPHIASLNEIVNEPVKNIKTNELQHHFDTNNMVLALEKDGLTKSQSVVLMNGIKHKLRESIAKLDQDLLHRSDLENESYLFNAALSELRTEIQVMRQKDIQLLKSDTMMITREVEALGQKLNEDVDYVKNEIALDMESRKNETRSGQKEIDITIQELNNKFTVQLGEVKTSLEAVRWETIWKGLAGVAGSAIVIAGIAYYLTRYAEKRYLEIKLEKERKKKERKEEARTAGLVDMDVVY